MLISCPVEHLEDKLGGTDKAIELLKKAGFEAFDLSMCEMFRREDHWMNGENWREYSKHLKSVADKEGIVCNQAHAPFPSSYGDAEKDEWVFGEIVRSMEAASICGAKIIVVHPKQHLPYMENREALLEMNIEFYNRLIPYCEKFNIMVATENMWQQNRISKAIIDSTCSRADEFCEYIDKIDSKWITGCLDLGHVALINADLNEFARKMGKERLKSLHVHDNDGIRDLHVMPYTQRIDFDGFAKTLGEIGYEGDITFEASNFLKKFPDELLSEATALMCSIGKHMRNLAK